MGFLSSNIVKVDNDTVLQSYFKLVMLAISCYAFYAYFFSRAWFFVLRFRLDGPGKLPSTAWNIALDTCVENGELEKAWMPSIHELLHRERLRSL